VGIGQGAFLSTPLQLAVATATLANRGRFIEPRVARATHVPGLGAPEPIPARVRRLALDPGHVDRVIHAMTQVVEGQRGTARRIRSDAYRIAGKTGTAQVFTVGQQERYREEEVAERMRDHALFVAFAPVEEPRIAVAVIVENGGHGGAVAAPIARAVMDSYLLREARLADKGAGGGD
jgi:penicillin-binding protein 2